MKPRPASVFGPGPTPGTWWAPSPEPDTAALIVGDQGNVLGALSRSALSRRRARADAALAHGVTAAIHQVPVCTLALVAVDGVTQELPAECRWVLHAPTCPQLTEGSSARVLQRADVARAALAGRPVEIDSEVYWAASPRARWHTCLTGGTR